ncbi:hypothetical protein [Kutzneria sp. 744]|uniref:hypothetical protein n=1 Tax=Kutzneria sp. (strain 744) TaxID=345341 RepID=UPI0003EEBDDC|nr:hypothetical protein [Kutzneria sp. 744]EWM18330.1 hypothetical protein KUTG_08634 [Kutzneria sp. 744]
MNYRRLVRVSAGYDLVVTAAFVTPWTYELLRQALSAVGLALGLGAMPATDPTATMYADLMGSIVVVWAVLRLIDPHPVLGLYDGVARMLFAIWEAYAAVHGATGLLWGFFAVEVLFGVLQLAPWLSAHPPWPTRSFTARLRRSSRGSTP